MEGSEVVEKFYGVYLLKCLNPKYKGWTYIGYTVDPNRRIKQHNKGKLYGGAWKTSKKGPWEMTLTVHGFPSDVAALRFEWAWQHPKLSRRLRTIIPNKKSSETSFDYRLKIMFTMLSVPPWCRLPLTLRWLSADVMVDPPPNLTPPVHIPIVYGPVVSKKLKSPEKKAKKDENTEKSDEKERELHLCQICYRLTDEEDSFVCLNVKCEVRWHILCLAKHFLDNEISVAGSQAENKSPKNVIPVEGSCPQCESVILWGDLVRKKKGCYNSLTNTETETVDESSLFD